MSEKKETEKKASFDATQEAKKKVEKVDKEEANTDQETEKKVEKDEETLEEKMAAQRIWLYRLRWHLANTTVWENNNNLSFTFKLK